MKKRKTMLKLKKRKNKKKITPNVSFATRGFRFYEQDPGTEEYKARSLAPADFMQPVKQRIHQPLWNISPHEEKKALRETIYQEIPKERNKVEMIGWYTPTKSIQIQK